MANQQAFMAALVLFFCTLTAMGQPDNDHFSNAFQLAGMKGSYRAHTFGSSLEEGEPAEHEVLGDDGITYGTVWYRWEAPSRGALEIGPQFRGLLYRGANLESLQRVAELDTGTTVYEAYFPVETGLIYHIAERFTAGQETAFRLIPTLENDDFSSSETISAEETLGFFDSPSRQVGEPEYPAELRGGSLWWTIPAAEAEITTVRFKTTANGRFFLFEGESLSAMEAAAIEGEWAGGFKWIRFRTEPGKRYHLAFVCRAQSIQAVIALALDRTKLGLNLADPGEPLIAGLPIIFKIQNHSHPTAGQKNGWIDPSLTATRRV